METQYVYFLYANGTSRAASQNMWLMPEVFGQITHVLIGTHVKKCSHILSLNDNKMPFVGCTIAPIEGGLFHITEIQDYGMFLLGKLKTHIELSQSKDINTCLLYMEEQHYKLITAAFIKFSKHIDDFKSLYTDLLKIIELYTPKKVKQ